MSLETKIEMFGNPSSEFSISDAQLYNLLSVDADQNADYWEFQVAGVEFLLNKIPKLYVVSNGGFTFQVLCSDDSVSKVENLSIDEFIDTVRRNRIGRKTKYVVVGGA